MARDDQKGAGAVGVCIFLSEVCALLMKGAGRRLRWHYLVFAKRSIVAVTLFRSARAAPMMICECAKC